MGDRVRPGWFAGLGVAFAAAGTVVWAVGLAVYSPRIATAYLSWAEPGGVNYGRYGSDEMESLALLGIELRWSAIVLALAGVNLLLRDLRRPGLPAVAVAAGWFAADVLLGRAGVAGAWAATGAGLAVAAVLVAVVLAARRGQQREQPEYRPILLVYSGVLTAVGAIQTVPFISSEPNLRPGALLPVAVAQGVVLALAAVVTALAAAPAATWRRVSTATAVAVLLAATFGFEQAVRESVNGWTWYLPPAFLLPVPIAICVLGGAYQRWVGWGSAAILTVVTVALTMASLFLGFMLSLGLGHLLLMPVFGDPPGLGFLYVAAAALTGTGLGLVARILWLAGAPEQRTTGAAVAAEAS